MIDAPLLICRLASLDTVSVAPDLISKVVMTTLRTGATARTRGIGQIDRPAGEAGRVDVDVLEHDVAGQERDVGDGHVDGQVEGVAGQVAVGQYASAGQGEPVPGEVAAGGEVASGIDRM